MHVLVVSIYMKLKIISEISSKLLKNRLSTLNYIIEICIGFDG